MDRVWIALIGALTLLILVLLTTFLIWPDRVTKFMARFALLFKSIERTARNEPEPERRSGTERRASISDFAKTQAQPMDTKAIIAKIKERKSDAG